MTYTVERFERSIEGEWNEFVATSKNATFLLDRRYMDYHADRFVDHSLVFRDPAGQIVALLPANERDGELHSHAGLTYGGLVLGYRTGAAAVLELTACLRAYLTPNRLACLHYKTIPSIYHRLPAEEDRYALFRADARLMRRDVLSAVPREGRTRYQDRRNRGVKSASKAGVTIAETSNFGPFWNVLEENLTHRFGVRPVHSLAEIELLASRFPENIRLFSASVDNEVVAGTVIFETATVAHVQYISASAEGKRTHALDLLFHYLLSDRYKDIPWFDFGISNEDAGRTLNVGLLEQKEGFGARTVVHDYYRLEA